MHSDNIAIHALMRELPPIITSAIAKLMFQLTAFEGKFPAACSEQGRYPLTDNTDWTTGFWSGITGLAWQLSADPFFLTHLEAQADSFRYRLDAQQDIDTHDLGFLYSLSCVNAWRFNGNRAARNTALRAADHLTDRYLPVATIIQAWGDLNDPQQQGRMIIDCLMNLPLLYWATHETDVEKYAQYAAAHARQAKNFLLREDYSTFHTFYVDVHSGAPVKGTTHQGYADSSCWARGQAWALYGFALSYRATEERDFLYAAKESAHYFLNHLPEDGICHWDLALQTPGTHKDSSAAVIAACGLLEIAGCLSVLDPDRPYFIQQALKIAATLFKDYISLDLDTGGYLKHAVYNMNKGRGVDEYCTWGDYFFFELLSRLHSPLTHYW